MKRVIISILTILMLLPILLSCSPQKDPIIREDIPDSVQIREDGMHVKPSGLVRLYEYSFNTNYTLLEALMTRDAKPYYYSFPEDNEEKAILYRGFPYGRGGADTISRQDALYDVEFLYEVLKTPQKFFKQDIEIKNVFAMSETYGFYVYAITTKGHFVIFKENEHNNSEAYVFPAKDFEVFRKIQAEEFRRIIMERAAGDYSEPFYNRSFSIKEIMLQSKHKDELPKYAAPFDIEQYERNLVEEQIQKGLLFGGIPTVVLSIAVVFTVVLTAKKRKKKHVTLPLSPEAQPPQSPTPQDK